MTKDQKLALVEKANKRGLFIGDYRSGNANKTAVKVTGHTGDFARVVPAESISFFNASCEVSWETLERITNGSGIILG